MSHEILAIAGDPSDAARRRRRHLIDHAAAKVPGIVGVQVQESAHVCIGLVKSNPAGGDVASISASDDGCRTSIALTESGLAAAADGDGRRSGSEAGHVSVFAAADGSVELTTDGFATIGAYWAVSESSLLIATHLASIVSLGVPAVPDEQGVIEYLAMLHPMGARTMLSGASLLEPGSKLTWSDGQLDLAATPLFTPGEPHGNLAATVGRFRDVWRDVISGSIERAAGRRLLVALSGGMDSRIIAAQCVRSGGRPVSYTYGGHAAREVQVAGDIAERLGLPHLRLPVTDDDMLAGADGGAQLLDGAHAPAQMYELWFAERLRSIGDVVINGLGGGTLMGDDKLMGLNDTSTMIERVIGRYSQEVSNMTPLLSPHSDQNVTEILRTSIGESFAPWDGLDRADAGVYWRIANRQFRWGNMFHTAMRRSGLRPDTPFLDGRFLDFAACLSPEQRLNGALYLEVHQQVFSETADLPRSDDGNSPRDLNHAYWSGDRRFATQLGQLAVRHPISASRRAARRVVKLTTPAATKNPSMTRVADRRTLRESVFSAEAFARSSPSYAHRLADELDRSRGATPLLDDDVITEAASGLRSGQTTQSVSALGKVAALGAWLNDYRERADDHERQFGSRT